MDRRSSLRKPVHFFVVGPDGPRQNRARSADLSPCGIQVLWARPPQHAENDAIELQLYLPAADAPMKVRASSVWRDGRREGLRFVELEDVERLELAEVMDRSPERA